MQWDRCFVGQQDGAGSGSLSCFGAQDCFPVCDLVLVEGHEEVKGDRGCAHKPGLLWPPVAPGERSCLLSSPLVPRSSLSSSTPGCRVDVSQALGLEWGSRVLVLAPHSWALCLGGRQSPHLKLR